MLKYFTSTLPDFAATFGTAVAIAVVFLALYSRATPQREFALVRDGNTAAATQIVGTFIGFTIPLGVVISHSVNVVDMLIWGAVAAIVQLLVYLVIARFLFKAISQRISEGCMASGVFVGGMGLGFGVLQAASMVP